MRNVLRRMWVVAGLTAMASWMGCNGTTTSKQHGDGGTQDQSVAVCTAAVADCADTHTVRTCAAGGASFYYTPCPSNDLCMGGQCVLNTAGASCTPGSGTCTNSTTGLSCNANGVGYKVVTCPAATTCTGNGQCVGACVVGETKCGSAGTLLTCDGNTFQPTSCAANTACWATPNSSPAKAACVATTDCQPDANGCDTVCGNPLVASSDPTKSTATCVGTPTGFHWLVTPCTLGVCSTTAGVCSKNSSLSDAACAAACVPGSAVCDESNNIITCGANGEYGPPVSCGNGTVCLGGPDNFDDFKSESKSRTKAKRISPRVNYPNAVCGNPVCADGGAGTCVIDPTDGLTKLSPCLPDGTLGTTLVTCNPGACVTLSDIDDDDVRIRPAIGGNSAGQPGLCAVECQPGDTQCVSNSVQGCVNGVWSSALTQCTGTNDGTAIACQSYNTATGSPRAVCGVCNPGQTRCTPGTAPVDGGVNLGEGIDTCGSDGLWGGSGSTSAGPPQLCPLGYCYEGGCQADCMPGTILCTGNTATGNAPLAWGTNATELCPADGNLSNIPPGSPQPTPNPCATGTSCRTDQTGNVIGCVACVGSTLNEQGLVDTACANPDGTMPSPGPYTSIVTCGTNNQWQTSPTACPSNNICAPPTRNGNSGIGENGATPYCHDSNDSDFPSFLSLPYLPMVTASTLQSLPSQVIYDNRTANIVVQGCSVVVSGVFDETYTDGIAVTCNGINGGSVPDCCSGACYADDSPSQPASCTEVPVAPAPPGPA